MSEQNQTQKKQYKLDSSMCMKNLHAFAAPNAELFNSDAKLIRSFGGKVNLGGIDSPDLDIKEYYAKLNDMLCAVNSVLQEPGLDLPDRMKYNNMKNEITRMKAEISINVWTQREKNKMLANSRRLENIDMIARMEMEDELKGK